MASVQNALRVPVREGNRKVSSLLSVPDNEPFSRKRDNVLDFSKAENICGRPLPLWMTATAWRSGFMHDWSIESQSDSFEN